MSNGTGEILHNFKTSEEINNWMSRKICETDRTKSEVIRTCIFLALPTIAANPSLVDHVRFEDIRQ